MDEYLVGTKWLFWAIVLLFIFLFSFLPLLDLYHSKKFSRHKKILRKILLLLAGYGILINLLGCVTITKSYVLFEVSPVLKQFYPFLQSVHCLSLILGLEIGILLALLTRKQITVVGRLAIILLPVLPFLIFQKYISDNFIIIELKFLNYLWFMGLVLGNLGTQLTRDAPKDLV